MGQTDKWALPYPEADTLISVSAPIVQELAEKIDAALSAATASDEYIIPGTLIGDFTTSGTFTPPAGVTVVHVAVIGGGAAGCYYGGSTYTGGTPGGSGGGVRVYRTVPVSGPVAVTVGGSNTGSAFGALTAPTGWRAPNDHNGVALAVWSPNVVATDTDTNRVSCPGYSIRTMSIWGSGYDGVKINGTFYAGGGGGGAVNNGGALGKGGAGGGGSGVLYGGANPGRPGVNGLGGGGGGDSGNPGGGSGRVMVWTEQTTRDTVPAPIDPVIMAALDTDGVMVGAYAVDPVAPVDTLGTLVPLPDEPQPTGDTFTDPETGDTRPDLAWPEKGWTYNDGEWSPPDD